MIRFIRWLLGYVEFEFKKGFVQGFIGDIYADGIRAFHIKSEENRLTGGCHLGDYKKLHRLALKNGGTVRIVKKHGIIFPILRLRSRFGLVVGGFAFVMIICAVSGFVWQIDVVGNEKAETKNIVSFLEQNGLKKGVYWDNIDKDYLESLMLANFSDIAWAHINENGSVARIEISETIPKPELNQDDKITNVKATKDGIIVRNTAYEGWETVKAGDSVVKGDLLISGIYQSDKKKRSVFAHARGEVIAKVEEPFSLTINREQQYKRYTYQKTYKELYFFGIIIPLHLPIDYALQADVSKKSEYIRLNKRNLPIGINYKIYSYYDTCTKRLSDRELTKLMNEEIERSLSKKYADNEIIKREINVALNSDNSTAKGRIVTIQDIGEEVPVNKK